MICAGPLSGTKNSTLKKPPSNPSAGSTRAADVRELVQPLLRERARVLEALEADGARVLDRVGDADRRHLAAVHVALERHLVAGEELLGEEAVGRAPDRRPPARRSRRSGSCSGRSRAGRAARRGSSIRKTFCDRRPTTGLTKNGTSNGGAAVEEREARRRLRRDALLDGAGGRLVLAGDERLRARPRQPAPLGQERGEERRLVLRADDARRPGSPRTPPGSASGSNVSSWSRSEPAKWTR